MKTADKKPRTAKSRGPAKSRGRGSKKNKNKFPGLRVLSKKIGSADRIRAVFLAGLIIFTAGSAALAGLLLYSIETDSDGVNIVEVQVPAPASAPLSASVPAPSSPASVEMVPASARTDRSPSPAPAPVPPPASVEGPPPPEARAPAPNPVPNPVPAPAAPPPEVIERPPPPPARVERPSPARVERPPPVRGTLVFVIDDAGNNLWDLEPFLQFPGALTIAVLPGLPDSIEAARRIRAAGKEVFLHQPMESLGGSNPGPGAIFSGMGRDEIREIVSRNLDELWPVAGMNNHEGSRITMDEEAMEVILEICRERGIPFLDSRTTAETAAPRTARRLEMFIGERDIFLDNDQDEESILDFINMGLSRAEERGSVIMIGHVWSPALAPLLLDLYQDLSDRGFSFSTAAQLINDREP